MRVGTPNADFNASQQEPLASWTIQIDEIFRNQQQQNQFPELFQIGRVIFECTRDDRAPQELLQLSNYQSPL